MRYALYTGVIVALMAMASAAWSQAFSQADLDELLGPIALYPDPLLAQVLPAATFPDQLKAANDLVQSGGSATIESQPWDVSVKSVAHYPDVLNMMATNTDWTIALGQAFVNQPQDVTSSIQRLRGKAQLMGYLSSNSQQQVTSSNNYISIVPAQPQYIYVPTYNPAVVYATPSTDYAGIGIAFGVGLLIGSWLNNSFDWGHHRVYYHGWHGGGWIGRSRPFVNVHNRTFVNNKWVNRSAPVNRGVRNKNIGGFRRDLGRNPGSFTPPGLVRPGMPTTRPGIPGAGPGTRPGVPTRPGVRPGAPTRPGVPTRPGMPGGGPGVRPRPGTPGTRPGVGPRPGVPGGGTMPRPMRPARPGIQPRPTPPTAPSMPGRGPGFRPGGGPRTMPTTPVARPRPAERPNIGTSRPSPPSRPGAARPSGGGAGPSGRQGRSTNNNRQPR